MGISAERLGFRLISLGFTVPSVSGFRTVGPVGVGAYGRCVDIARCTMVPWSTMWTSSLRISLGKDFSSLCFLGGRGYRSRFFGCCSFRGNLGESVGAGFSKFLGAWWCYQYECEAGG